MKKYLLQIILIVLLFPVSDAYSYIDALEITVIGFSNESDEFILTFKANDYREGTQILKKKERKYIVHIKYIEKDASEYANLGLTFEEHNKAIQFLVRQIDESKTFNIGRMSGQGYIPIKGKKGHYKTIAVKLNKNPLAQKEYITFFH